MAETQTRTFITKPCIVCHLTSEVELDAAKVARYEAGEHVQNVWPEKSASQRELLITGTHPVCWDNMFADDDE